MRERTRAGLASARQGTEGTAYRKDGAEQAADGQDAHGLTQEVGAPPSSNRIVSGLVREPKCHGINVSQRANELPGLRKFSVHPKPQPEECSVLELNTSALDPQADRASARLIRFFQERGTTSLVSLLYYQFPMYRSEAGELIVSTVLYMSTRHGIIVFGTSEDSSNLPLVVEQLSEASSAIYSKLLRNKALRRSPRELISPVTEVLFTLSPPLHEVGMMVLSSEPQLQEFLDSIDDAELTNAQLREMQSSLEGSKALIRPSTRATKTLPRSSRAHQIVALEQEIANFDQRQKRAFMTPVVGPQRIRGLAGSGKTVVLAMKAALVHLMDPDARILVTFHTKSLYQHVRRMITRFYRQYDDRDPDWERLTVLHSWGGGRDPGVYYNACIMNGLTPLDYSTAKARHPSDPFSYCCEQFLETVREPRTQYDYVFVDEGQDLPDSFLRLCAAVVAGKRFVVAYDELQSIFRTETRNFSELFGVKLEAKDDIVLKKCYRNPREVLFVAHAVGFGIYGPKIVQMLESKEHWEDIGYQVLSEELIPGKPAQIKRPRENSLQSVSDASPITDIVLSSAHKTAEEEIAWVVESICSDLSSGLQPDDIVVISVDDRNARTYFQGLSSRLRTQNIPTYNVHEALGVQDFAIPGAVTLTTVHKAKGNEAYMVYVLGIDAPYTESGLARGNASAARTRNVIFTALTRAKAWVRISGVDPAASEFFNEVSRAIEDFPTFRFTYPSTRELRQIKRDLQHAVDKEQRLTELLGEIQGLAGDADVEDFVRRHIRNAKKFDRGSDDGGKK
jgi:superfamily I DNA and RNA helicase